MAEGTGMDYRTGFLRRKYLDYANMSFAQENYITSKKWVENFVDTIKEESQAGKQIIKEFDKVVIRKRKQIEELKKEANDLGYLEKKDVEDNGRANIEVNAIHDMKEICWSIAEENGLFQE